MPMTIIGTVNLNVRDDNDQDLEELTAVSGTEAISHFLAMTQEDGAHVFMSLNQKCVLADQILLDVGVDSDQDLEELTAVSGTEAISHFLAMTQKDGAFVGGVEKCPVWPGTPGNAWDFFHIPI